MHQMHDAWAVTPKQEVARLRLAESGVQTLPVEEPPWGKVPLTMSPTRPRQSEPGPGPQELHKNVLRYIVVGR